MRSPVKSYTASLGGLEPPTFRLTAERANRLRHRDVHAAVAKSNDSNRIAHVREMKPLLATSTYCFML